MGHQDLNYWKNKDGTTFTLCTRMALMILAVPQIVQYGGDFEIMVFHADGDPAGGYQDGDVCVRCDIIELGNEINSFMKLYDDPGVMWTRKNTDRTLYLRTISIRRKTL